MAFRPIPDLPDGFSIEKSGSTGLYYYFNKNTGISLYLTIPPPPRNILNLPKGWRLDNYPVGGGAGAPPEFVGPNGTRLPFYNTHEEYDRAIIDWTAAAPAAPSAALSGQKRQRNGNNRNNRQTKYARTGNTMNVSQARVVPVCIEPMRDPRHVTTIIHNIEDNTFLIGTENVYARNVSGEEIGLIRFTEFLTGDLLHLHDYINNIRNILSIIGVSIAVLNRPDIFPVPAPQDIPITNELIDDIMNRIGRAINLQPMMINNYHVKKVIKDEHICTDIIIMQKRTWGGRQGFPKGAVEKVDTIDQSGAPIVDNTEILKNAARREVREEVRFNYQGTIQYLGTITLSGRESHVCYIPVDKAAAAFIIEVYNARQISSELFDVKFVDCDYLSDLRSFNGLSQQIINEITGTQSITYIDGVKRILFNKCAGPRRGGKRRRSSHKKSRGKTRKTRK